MPTSQLTVHAPIYEHRPTRVRAMQLTGSTYREVFAWMREAGAYWWRATEETAELLLWLDSAAPGQDSMVRVRTPQGARKVLMGDWIVWGVGGIWYPVHDEVFRESYVSQSDLPPPDRHHDDD